MLADIARRNVQYMPHVIWNYYIDHTTHNGDKYWLGVMRKGGTEKKYTYTWEEGKLQPDDYFYYHFAWTWLLFVNDSITVLIVWPGSKCLRLSFSLPISFYTSVPTLRQSIGKASWATRLTKTSERVTPPPPPCVNVMCARTRHLLWLSACCIFLLVVFNTHTHTT